jgi:hypothetical protein
MCRNWSVQEVLCVVSKYVFMVCIIGGYMYTDTRLDCGLGMKVFSCGYIDALLRMVCRLVFYGVLEVATEVPYI